MNEWLFALITLAVAQVYLYEMPFRTFLKISLRFWFVIYASMLLTEMIDKVFWLAGMLWWKSVVASFASYIFGEWMALDLKVRKEHVPKVKQAFPTLFGFSAVFMVLAWHGLGGAETFDTAHAVLICVSLASVILTALVIGIWERLCISDIPQVLRGLPILLISAALLMIALSWPLR